MIKINDGTLIIFSKILISFLIFNFGVYEKDIFKSSNYILWLSIIIICVEFIISQIGLGYQYWGSIKTFSGFYYFKTDLALSIVIAMSYILYFYNKNFKLKILLLLLGFYIIFLSNARIHLLTSFLLVVMYFLQNYIITKPTRAILIMCIMGFGFIIGVSVILVLINLSGGNFLSIDINDPLGGSNTQGRNKIWEVILEKFNKADFSDRLVGLGLSFDSEMNKKFSETGDGNNSHNGYIYIMVSIGYLGLLCFIRLFYLTYKRFELLSRRFKFDEYRRILLMLFLSHLLIFLLASVSTASIMFQQQTWFLFYFMGILYNKKYFPNIPKVRVNL